MTELNKTMIKMYLKLHAGQYYRKYFKIQTCNQIKHYRNCISNCLKSIHQFIAEQLDASASINEHTITEQTITGVCKFNNLDEAYITLNVFRCEIIILCRHWQYVTILCCIQYGPVRTKLESDIKQSQFSKMDQFCQCV